MAYSSKMRKKTIDAPKFILLNQRTPTWRIALRISLLYLLFGLVWILISDSVVVFLIADEILRTEINMAKGFIFVLLSSIFIYMLIAPSLRKLSDNEEVITENRNELSLMLYYDYLTGLSNRRKLLERLPVFLQEGPGKGKALLYIDIDNIKLVNDTLGHIYGDLLIAETGKQLSSILSPPDELYRLGGDEFIILIPYIRIAEIEEKTENILKIFKTPFTIDKISTHCTVSIGIALYPLHSLDPGVLMKCADIAMYRSKKQGKNGSVLYDPSMMEGINERMIIGEKLHDALLNKELEVFFQPQIDTKTGKVVSYEALLRWTNPVLGKVSPEIFIPVAEEMHLIIAIGEWVLLESCRFLRKMHEEGFRDLTMSVNVSIIQMVHENFESVVEQILAVTGVDPAKLELEITETILMESSSNIKTRLEAFRKKGIGIALDDFGKGYSSLSYLEQLPISILKIDKTFVDRIPAVGEDLSIIGNIIGIGKKLGMTVIAEGVESQSQFDFLASRNCDKIQGWFFCKALPAPEAEAFTRRNRGG